jgi:hypothetical protein
MIKITDIFVKIIHIQGFLRIRIKKGITCTVIINQHCVIFNTKDFYFWGRITSE